MLRIYLKSLRCLEETDEAGRDEPYVLVTAVDLGSKLAVPGGTLPVPSSEVVLYGPYGAVDKGDVRFSSGPSHSFWGVDGTPSELKDPGESIFLVSLLEQDDGRPSALRTIVKGAAAASILATLPLKRPVKLEKLLGDVNDAASTPTGAPSPDERLGTVELSFTAAELERARQGKPTGKRVEISGDGGRYELNFEAVAVGGIELASAGSASLTGGIAAVARKPENLEIWWIGADGSVEGAFWREKEEWRRYQLAGAGAAELQSGIAAVSRTPEALEVWWIGPRGTVKTAVRSEGSVWAFGEIAGGGEAEPTGGIAAVSRGPDKMDLWWVGAGGSLERAMWTKTTQGQRSRVAEIGEVALTSAIGAASRRPDVVDVWWIGPDGSVQGASLHDDGAEERYEIAVGRTASASGGIGGVSRRPDTLDVWWIGVDRSVQGAAGPGKKWRRYRVADPLIASQSGSIAPTSRKPGTMEFWFAGGGGSVEDAFWYDGQAWIEVPLTRGGAAAEQATMAAVTRLPNTWEMWFVGKDGSIQDRFWYER